MQPQAHFPVSLYWISWSVYCSLQCVSQYDFFFTHFIVRQVKSVNPIALKSNSTPQQATQFVLSNMSVAQIRLCGIAYSWNKCEQTPNDKYKQ